VKSIKTALISVFYKDGIDELANYLHQNGTTILSTGGTQKYLEAMGIPVVPVEEITSYPSILGGRVKTLHPAVFGGILNRGDNPTDQEQLEEFNIQNIDLIWVDLYPFEETVANTTDEQEIIEKIDIGGVSLIRAAAKNYKDKLILSDQSQSAGLLAHLQSNNGQSSKDYRKKLASEAFRTTTIYDRHIANYFYGNTSKELRYGENPHQKAKYVGDLDSVFNQIHGKALSYNNLLDIDAAISLISDFKSETSPVFGIFKHNNACGFAIRNTVSEAYADALAGDPVSAFGGVLVTLSTIDKATAEQMNSLFFEVLIAPDFDQDALDILQTKKNRILLRLNDFEWKQTSVRSSLNGRLIQERDSVVVDTTDYNVVSTTKPSEQQIADLRFANILCKHTKSNAIVLAKNNQLLASGTGQTSRVDALNQAIEKAGNFNFDLNGCVMASDAFFPFPDCVEIADKAGVKAVIQPGGSIKDQLSTDYCNEHGMAMVMTGHRHFKH
jgi:phosphoribosylaminoimidazolecarboxamide formyltransferase / IMP cyclohydrolase